MAAGSEQEGEPTRPRVLLANINRGQVSSAFMMGAIQALQQDVIHGMVVVESGPYLDDGRNKAIANALQLPDWEWLLFVDSDIEWQPYHVATLLAPYSDCFDPQFYPVIAGVYVNPFDDGLFTDNVGPVVYDWGPYQGIGAEEGMKSFVRLSRDELAYRLYENENHPDVTRAAAVGTGFLALHRSLLLEMQDSYRAPLIWFHEPVVGGVHFGEDMGFCLRLRDLGYPVLVNRACTPIHHKTMKLI